MDEKPKDDGRTQIDGIILTVLLLICVVMAIYYYKKNNVVVIPVSKSIPHGTTKFLIPIENERKGPQMSNGIINPYDPEIGGTQRVTITVSDTEPVTKVIAILKTDTKTSEPYPLFPGAGTSMNSNWTGVWTMDDSYIHTYILTIKATSINGTSSAEIKLR